MTRDNAISRRTAMKMTGAAAATALVAGCSDDEGGNGGDDDDGSNDDGGSDGYEIESGTMIELNAQTAGWEGIAPSDIEGEENPTLVLQEGEDYEIGWPNESDGSTHNIEIRDDGGDVVDDLSTEEDNEPSEDQVLEFTASSEMASYVCNPHETTMIGDLVVE
ncbi:hypothetical protein CHINAEXTREME_05340 [Halobiforma lacisalsi AJ5]|uniref:Blue (Type 1) copper domain-containing protein n=1 Tax=Natronobacterium lacisalsi AJ5 TaxID=358396 RepID=M0LNN6_NATLA|nr:plastocyanin/azurin family copper-binding protein [Halobiforma lacisalsi]APW97230.1 hypothetical protein CHINAEXTREME_05340 [Halobiforma lacisalsi AJ5]EMA34064.1 blue (type 1) copper domain-containing protein [Halobiforma lacisalsi AJ5]